jgi:hypothetical protein
MNTEDDLVQRVGEQRSAAWSAVGDLDPYVVGHIINPVFMGGPRWPALRQGFVKVVLADGTALIASDGLTDPNDATTDTGRGAEVYVVAPLASVPVGELAKHWQFQVVYEVAQNVAANPADLAAALEKYGVLSMSVAGAGVPEEWLDAEYGMGVIIGVPHPVVPASIELETGRAGLAQAVVLRPAELRTVMDGGTPARVELGARLAAMPMSLLTDPERPSLV